MRINTNLTAMNTYTQYTKNNNKIASAVEKLSSGYAINSAADNAAGLAISEKMRAQIRGLDQASSNAQDAISLVQTAEGALASSTEILQRMREIAVQSSSDTNNNEIDREALQDEFTQLKAELDEISSTTSFNKKNLLDGSLASSKSSVEISKLANSTTAVSIGQASAGNYSFTVSTKQETSAVASKDATGTAALGTEAKATIDSASVAMGEETKGTALYNGNYTLSSTVDANTGSITVKATGDNGQNFSCTLEKSDIHGLTSLSLDFETADGAKDSFALSLNLASAADANSENSLKSLASAIDNVTVSVDGGVDKKDATYGVYANCTGATSVKLNEGDSSVTFDNGVTVSFDTLTATDVAVDSNSSVVLTPTAIADVETNGTAGAITANVALADLTATFGGLDSGDAFVITVNGTDYSGTYKGETGSDLDNLLTTTLAGSESNIIQTQTGAAYAMTMAVSNGVVTYTSGDNTAANALGSNVFSISTPATGTAAAYTEGTASTAATFTNTGNAIDTTAVTGEWAGATQGSKVNVQIGDTVYEGTYDTSVDKTLANLLNGKSYTDSNDVTYTFTGSTAGVFTFTATTVGVTTALTGDDAITFSASTRASGDKAVLSDGMVSKLGKTTDQNSTSTTATTFAVKSKENAGLTFQVGANQGDSMSINIDEVNSESLGVNSAKVGTQEAATAAISTVDKAINKVSAQRAYLGAVQNRLDYKIDNLNTSSENLTSAESQIRNVDMAKEMTNFTNSNILQQAATAMLAQANSLPQNVLSLIG